MEELGVVSSDVCSVFVAWSRLTLDVEECGIRIIFLLSFTNRTQEHDFITIQTQNGKQQRQQQPLMPSLNPTPSRDPAHTPPGPPPNTCCLVIGALVARVQEAHAGAGSKLLF